MRRAIRVDANTVDNWRRKFGHAFEHAETKGDRRGVWLFAPDWLPAYYAATADKPAAAEPEHQEHPLDHADRLKKAQADRAELELARLLGKLLDIDDAKRNVDLLASKVREGIELLGRVSVDAQRVMVDKLDEASSEWARLYGDSDSGQTNGKPRALPASDRKSHAESGAESS